MMMRRKKKCWKNCLNVLKLNNMKNKNVKVIGMNMDGDESYVGKIGKVKKVVEDGCYEGCVEVKFEDGVVEVFFEDEVEVI